MTDTYGVLLAALTKAAPGATWSADAWRDEADLAQLTSAERGAAQTRAVDDGYLVPLGEYRDGRWLPLCDRTTHARGKGRWVQVLERTSKPLPGQAFVDEVPWGRSFQIEGQTDLFEMVGGA